MREASGCSSVKERRSSRPEVGGSSPLARSISLARDVFLDRRRRATPSLVSTIAGWLFARRRRWDVVRESAKQERAPWADGFRLRPARPADLFALAELGRERGQLTIYWLARRHVVWVAERAGRPVAYRCVAMQPPWPFAQVVTLEPGEAWVVDSFVEAEHRDREVEAALAAAMGPALRDRGIDTLYSAQHPEHGRSAAMSETAGLVRVGTATRWRLLGVTLIHFERTEAVSPTSEPAAGTGAPGWRGGLAQWAATLWRPKPEGASVYGSPGPVGGG